MNPFQKTKLFTASFAQRIQWKTHLPWCAGLLAIVLILFGKYLISSTEAVSAAGGSVYSQYLHLRSFVSTEITSGNLPAWNPFAYGGYPVIADFHTALLYPPTWLLAFFNPVTAINWWVAAHVFLFGFLTYVWAATRGMRPFAGFVAGAAAMLGGAFYMRVYAGHIPELASMAWAPLVFAGIDGWLTRKHSGWIVLGAAGAALQVYAGSPECACYTAIAAGLHALIHLVRSGADWKKMLAGVAALYPLAVLLALAQLLPAWMEISETLRGVGDAYAHPSQTGFAPENLLTLLAPWVYGGPGGGSYWGRGYIWEQQLFFGAGVLVLAVLGVVSQNKTARVRTAILLGVLALLAFVVSAKFIFLISLFLAMAAGMGIERLATREKRMVRAGVVTVACGLVLVLLGVLVQTGALSTLQPAARSLTGGELLTGGVWLAVFGGLLFAVNYRKEAAWAFGALAVLNVFLFAWENTTGFDSKRAMLPPDLSLSITAPERYKASLPPMLAFIKDNRGERDNRGDYRTLNAVLPAANMSWRNEAVWGVGPVILKRYAEYVAFSQNVNPDQATQRLGFTRKSPLLDMLRCRFAFIQDNNGNTRSVEMGEPLPRFIITSQFKVLKNRDEILKTIVSPGFSARQQALLESAPNPLPDNENIVWNMRVLTATSNAMRLEVTCDKATLLVMSDPYARGWKALPVTQAGKGVLSVQTNYDILPANYCMRAIPLAAGHHLIRLEYEQPGLETGVKLSLLTTLIVAVFILVPALRRKLCFAD